MTPIDYFFEDDQSSEKSNLKMFDNQRQFEAATQLINSNDPYLVEFLSRTLSQIDTSKILKISI